MARSSMAWLIVFLRAKVNDTDSSIWTDDELQNYLDMHRVHVRRELLSKSVDKRIYYSNFGMLESCIQLWDSSAEGATEISPDYYTANLIDGTFNFSSAQNGNYWLDANAYDIHGAIAECLEQLAMDQNKAREWQRGGVKYSHYDLLEMSRYHRGISGLKETNVIRVYR